MEVDRIRTSDFVVWCHLAMSLTRLISPDSFYTGWLVRPRELTELNSVASLTRLTTLSLRQCNHLDESRCPQLRVYPFRLLIAMKNQVRTVTPNHPDCFWRRWLRWGYSLLACLVDAGDYSQTVDSQGIREQIKTKSTLAANL